MKKVFSWTIVFAIAIYFLSVMVLPFSGMVNSIPFFIGLAFAIAGIGAVGLIVVLIKERLKDMEKEKDDLKKY